MAKYLFQEWCDLYKEEINKSKAYHAGHLGRVSGSCRETDEQLEGVR
jgi:hypothetical protein